MALKRIKKELYSYSKDPCPEISLGPNPRNPGDLFHLLGSILGPANSPYEDCLFFVSVELPHDYPFKPPNILFLTPIFHPNIDKRGNTCLDVLGTDWSPALTISKVLSTVQSFLLHPNPDDPFVYEVARLCKEKPEEFARLAREQARVHAW